MNISSYLYIIDFYYLNWDHLDHQKQLYIHFPEEKTTKFQKNQKKLREINDFSNVCVRFVVHFTQFACVLSLARKTLNFIELNEYYQHNDDPLRNVHFFLINNFFSVSFFFFLLCFEREE